jgi:hypothetical protein
MERYICDQHVKWSPYSQKNKNAAVKAAASSIKHTPIFGVFEASNDSSRLKYQHEGN